MTDHPSALVSVPVEADGPIASAIAASIRKNVPGNLYADSGIGRLIWRDAIVAAPAAPQAAGVGEVDEDWIRGLIGEAVHMKADDIDGDSEELSRISEAVLDAIRPYLRAPSREPEGGAVSEGELRDAITLILPLAKGYAAAHPVGSNQSYVDYVEGLIATREEAPAGAGEIEELFSQGHNFIATCKECGVAFDAHLRGCSNARPAALRAQPQAREDAQPVGWRLIDSAPTDGTVIDVWRAEGGKDTVRWGKPHHDCGEAGSYCDSDWHSIRGPGWVCNTFDEFIGRNHNPFTHWKPLDEGPDAVPAPAFAHPDPDALLEHERLFKALRDESWDLRCFGIPTAGGDDFDIGWRVIGHWQAEPRERTVAEVFSDDPVEAVRQALAALQAEQKGGA